MRRIAWSGVAVACVAVGALRAGQAAAQASRPAEFYFGTYNRNDELAAAPEKDWPGLLEQADGVLLHFGYWLNNDQKLDPAATGRKLAPVLARRGKRTLLETGWPPIRTPRERLVGMGASYAREHVEKIRRLEAATGLRVDEVNAELRLFAMEQLLSAHPELTTGEELAALTAREWTTYVSTLRRELGDRPVHLVCPPVYVPWGDYWYAGQHFDLPVWPAFRGVATRPASGPASTQPARVRLDGRAWYEAMLSADGVAGYSMDSPEFLTNNATYIKLGYLRKLVEIQGFVRGRGQKVTFIVNASPDEKKLPRDAWDAEYWRRSLRSLQNFQAAGGRADRYLYESWYAGPFTMVPETREDSATHGATRVVKYLRGPGEALSLAPAGEGTWRLTNAGSVACMPVVRLRGDREGWRVAVAGADASRAATGDEGHVVTSLLEPGAAVEIKVAPPPGATGTLEARWNPQDPAPAPRASVRIVGPASAR